MIPFKIPSPNERKIHTEDLCDILFLDRDPVFHINSDSESDDDLAVVYLKRAARDIRNGDLDVPFVTLMSNNQPGRPKSIKPEKPAIKVNKTCCETSGAPVHVVGLDHSKGDGHDKTEVIRKCGNDKHLDEDIHFSARIDDPVTLKWLADNFECHGEYSVPRGDMYQMFTQYCLEHGIRFMSNQATFGKSVRMMFRNLRTRRIGIRGQSRYHYDGLRPKMNSYVSDKLIPRKAGSMKLQEDYRDYRSDSYQGRQEIDFGPTYPSDHLITTLIPKFPTIGTIEVDNTRSDKMCIFLMLYRCYVVDILKTVIKTRFTQLEQITESFWSNLSHDITNALIHTDTLTVLQKCDRMMYNCVIRLLVPNVLTHIPTGMIGLLEKTFGESFIQQHSSALSSCPQLLQNKSVEEATRFTKKLSERLKLCYLCSQARETLQCSEATKSIRNVIKSLDTKSVVDVACFPTFSVDYNCLLERIENGIYEFQQLLAEKAKFSKYIYWLESVIQKVFSSASIKGNNHQSIGRVVVLEMNLITSIIARKINFYAAESVQSRSLINPLPDNNILRLSKLKEVADGILDVKKF